MKDIPSTQQFEKELKRLRYRQGFIRTMMSTIGSLTVVAAIAIIISNMLLPVLRVTGTSMTPTLQNDEVLLCSKFSETDRGDIVAFYYNNKVLLKRVIALSGDVINISDDGTVYLNDEQLDDPYVSELALGECDIEMPYKVPDNRIFVMGDNRAVSIDSRSATVGCIAEENVIGKVFFRIMPFKAFGII